MKKNLTISSILLATLFSMVCLVPDNGKSEDSKPAAEATALAQV